MVGIVQLFEGPGGVREPAFGFELPEGLLDGDPVAFEKVAVALVVGLDLRCRKLHHLGPAPTVELEVGDDVGDLAGLGLRVALLKRGQIEFSGGVEEAIEVFAALFLAILVRSPKKHPGVQADQPPSRNGPNSREFQRLHRREVAGVLSDLHLGGGWTQSAINRSTGNRTNHRSTGDRTNHRSTGNRTNHRTRNTIGKGNPL